MVVVVVVINGLSLSMGRLWSEESGWGERNCSPPDWLNISVTLFESECSSSKTSFSGGGRASLLA